MAKAKQSDPNLQEVKQDGGITRAGLKVLVLLAFQNCVKNLVMRAAVSGDAHFSVFRGGHRHRGHEVSVIHLYVRVVYGRFTTNDLLISTDGVAQVRVAGGAGGHLQLPANSGVCR